MCPDINLQRSAHAHAYASQGPEMARPTYMPAITVQDLPANVKVAGKLNAAVGEACLTRAIDVATHHSVSLRKTGLPAGNYLVSKVEHGYMVLVPASTGNLTAEQMKGHKFFAARMHNGTLQVLAQLELPKREARYNGSNSIFG